ncbi:MAG: M23 family metallopeptidase [Micromonosporaceae bacterium]
MTTTVGQIRTWLGTRTLIMLAALVTVASGATVAADAAPAYAAFGAMHQPTSGVVTSKIDNRCPGSDNHDGIDIANNTGTRVYAAYRGRVTFRGWSGDYGRLLIIDHPHGYTTRYAHLSDFDVADGASVSRGQLIGNMGASGNATGPHLHFEVRRFGGVHRDLNQGYTCGNSVTAKNSIRAPFPDLPA